LTTLPSEPGNPGAQPQEENGDTQVRQNAGMEGQETVPALLGNRYQLMSCLGNGGMGAVFEAHDLLVAAHRDPDPYVAIKVLRPDLQSDEVAVMALQREANRALKLAHPGIVRVRGFEQDAESGLYFIVMELLEGRTLQSVMRQHAAGQSWAEIAPYVKQICEALEYAHREGELVHSDIKPSNLFITARGQVKVLDFGIAVPIPASDADDEESSTRYDPRKLGARTPEYSGVDVFLGFKPHGSDDVYSLAVVVYQWLSGRHPYLTEDSSAETREAPAPKAMEKGRRPAPLPGLPGWQNRALLRALALPRSERTETVQDFWREMSEPPALWRSPTAWALAGVLALILASGGVLLTSRVQQPTSSGSTEVTQGPAGAAASSSRADEAPSSGAEDAQASRSSEGVSGSQTAQAPAAGTEGAPTRPPPRSGLSSRPVVGTPHSTAPDTVAGAAQICKGPPELATVEAALKRGIQAQVALSVQPQGSQAYTDALATLRQSRQCLGTLRAEGVSTSSSERWERQQQQDYGDPAPDPP
jgi:hypothetical protein